MRTMTDWIVLAGRARFLSRNGLTLFRRQQLVCFIIFVVWLIPPNAVVTQELLFDVGLVPAKVKLDRVRMAFVTAKMAAVQCVEEPNVCIAHCVLD